MVNILRYPDIHERVCSMCNLNVVEDEYHFILQCEKYIDVRRRYLKKYYWQIPSCFKLVQLLSGVLSISAILLKFYKSIPYLP
jgi:hypothetical protein